MNNIKYSVIGGYRNKDNRDMHDRSWGRNAPREFIIRLDEDKKLIYTNPKLPTEIENEIYALVCKSMQNGVKRIECAICEKIKIRIYEILTF